MQKLKETPEQRAARQGGENELAGYDSAQRAKRQIERMDSGMRMPRAPQPRKVRR
jgi:hypothetical protein